MKAIQIAAILTILAVGLSSVSALSPNKAENNQQLGMGSLISLAKSASYKEQSQNDNSQGGSHGDKEQKLKESKEKYDKDLKDKEQYDKECQQRKEKED